MQQLERINYKVNYLFGLSPFTGDALEAADVDASGSVDAPNLAKVKMYLLGAYQDFD